MKGYLFDLDGTLIQSMHVWEDAVMRLFEKLHLEMDVEEAHAVFSGMKFSEVLAHIVKRFALKLSAQELYDLVIEDVRYQYAHIVEPVEGAIAFVKRCCDAGKRMCVVTANDTPLSEATLKRLGIWEDMEFILSSEESGLSKRTPQMVEKAMRRLQLKPRECVVLEDSLYAMKSAKTAGCYVIAIADPKTADYGEICKVADEVHLNLCDIDVK